MKALIILGAVVFGFIVVSNAMIWLAGILDDEKPRGLMQIRLIRFILLIPFYSFIVSGYLFVYGFIGYFVWCIAGEFGVTVLVCLILYSFFDWCGLRIR